MPGATPSVADLMAKTAVMKQQSQDAAQQMLADNADIQDASDESQDAIIDSGNIQASAAALKTGADFVAQQRKNTLANAAGVTDGADILVDTADEMRQAAYNKMSYLQQIRDNSRIGIQDDPGTFLYNMFKGTPDLKQAFNQEQDRFVVAQQANAAVNNLIQSGSKTYDDIRQSLDANSAAGDAQLALNTATVNANTVAINAARLNSDAVARVNGLNQQQLDNDRALNNAANQDRQFALEKERLAIQQAEFRERMDAKNAGNLEDSKALAWYNAGQLANYGKPPVDLATFKLLAKLPGKENVADSIVTGAQIEANPNQVIPISASPVMSVAKAAQQKVVLTPSQQAVGEFITKQKDAFLALPANAALGKKVTADTIQIIDEHALNAAKVAQTNLTGNEKNNPYELPGLGSILTSQALAGTQFATVMAANGANPDNKTFNPQVSLAELAENVAQGKIDINSASQGMATAVKGLMSQNEQIKQFQKFGLPGYKDGVTAFLPLPGVGPLGGNDRTQSMVNLADPVAIQKYLMKYQMLKTAQESANNFSALGAY